MVRVLLALCLVAAVKGFDLSTPIHPDRVQAIHDLKQILHTLTVEETKERFRQLREVHARSAPPPRRPRRSFVDR